MYTTIVILLILASVLMCLVVLIQESKGGGLAADYAGGNALLGAPKTTNVIQKITIGLAVAMVLLSIISTAALPTPKAADSILQMQPAATTAPVLPSAATTSEPVAAPVQTGEPTHAAN